jgi:uncharacterized membrane protein
MLEFSRNLLLIQVASTLAMVGLIWFVQIVHYPLYSRVGEAAFTQYEADHNRLTSWVVMPLMLAELGTALLLLGWRPGGVDFASAVIGLVLVLAIWLVTFTVQVPQHAALVTAYDQEIQQRLVAGNWFRTVAWTARGLLVLWMVDQALASGTSSAPTSAASL